MKSSQTILTFNFPILIYIFFMREISLQIQENPCPNPCPKNFVFYPKTSTCFLFETEVKDFNDTYKHCRKYRGGQIYEIAHPDELQWVKDKIGSNKTWVGIRDTGLEGVFLTVEKSINVASCKSSTDCTQFNFSADYINWKAGEPKNFDKLEDCVAFDKDGFSAELCTRNTGIVCTVPMSDLHRECTYCSLPCPDQGFRANDSREICFIASLDDKVAGHVASTTCANKDYTLWAPKTSTDLTNLSLFFDASIYDTNWRIGLRYKTDLYYYEDGSQAPNMTRKGSIAFEGKGECLHIRIKVNSIVLVRKDCSTVSNYLCSYKESFYGEACRLDSCARMGNMRCVKGVCQCEPNYAPGHTLCEQGSRKHRTCIPEKLGDQKCEPNQCKLGMECHINKTDFYGNCKCRDGWEKEPTTNYNCYQKTKLGSACVNDYECVAANKLSHCKQFSHMLLCMCKPKTYHSNGGCLQKKGLGEMCHYTDQCLVLNSTCIYSVCRCRYNFHESKGICELGKKVGDECYSDKQCESVNKFSRCGYVPSKDYFSQDVEQGLSTIPDLPHKKWSENITSSDVYLPKNISVKLCTCQQYRLYRRGKCDFASLNPKYSPCTHNSDCASPFSYCNMDYNVCYCLEGHYPHMWKQECVRGLSYNGSCGTSRDYCDLFDGSCHEDLCSCNEGYYEKNGTCHIRDFFLSPCQKDEQCQLMASRSKCVGSRCQCDKGMFDEKISDCRPAIPSGSYCEAKEMCTHLGEGYTCLYAKCACEGGMYEEGNKCHFGKKIGDTCKRTGECQVLTDDSECVGSTCMCVNEEKNAGPYTCTPIAASFNCLLNINFDISGPQNASFTDRIIIRNYISTLFSNIFTLEIGKSFVRLNLNYENELYFRILMKMYLKNSRDTVSESILNLINKSPHILGNGDAIVILNDSISITYEKGYCENMVNINPKVGGKPFLFWVGSTLCLIFSIIAFLSLKRLMGYKPRAHMPWKYDQDIPDPFVPTKDRLSLVLKLAKKLPRNMVTLGWGGKETKLTKVYMAYFYTEYYDFDFSYDYDYSYPYASTIPSGIRGDPYYGYKDSLTFYPIDKEVGLDSGYDDELEYDNVVNYDGRATHDSGHSDDRHRTPDTSERSLTPEVSLE